MAVVSFQVATPPHLLSTREMSRVFSERCDTLFERPKNPTPPRRDGQGCLSYGYHPVAAPPGYRLYYLWVLAGEVRRLTLYEDPDHRWIHDAER